MKTRKDMAFELAQDCLENATEGDLAYNYLKRVTADELREVYFDDHMAYYAMLDDDDLEQRYKDYFDDNGFDFDEQDEEDEE